jgi:hypothetical protein
MTHETLFPIYALVVFIIMESILGLWLNIWAASAIALVIATVMVIVGINLKYRE